MPKDHTISPDSPKEPQYTERDIDDALAHIIDHAEGHLETTPPGHEDYITGLVDGAQQFHRFLIHER